MSDEDLLKAYYTRPQNMEQGTRASQNENLQRQLSAFERLAQHAMSRFHKEKLYHMLQAVTNGIATIRGTKIVKDDKSTVVEVINSISKLREALTQLQNSSNKRKGILKDEETHVVKYFESFFNDVSFMKTLKSYFDERIYKCLYDYFYNPLDDVYNHRDEMTAIGETERGNEVLTPEDELNLKGKLFRKVSILFQLNQQWERILSDGQINVADFDPDSHYDISSFPKRDKFEPVFRLIPDVFVKCYKSVELAKQWWTLANKIYPNVLTPTQNRSAFEKNTGELREIINSLSRDLLRDEQLLKVLREKHLLLQAREKRQEILEHERVVTEEENVKLDSQYKACIKHTKMLHSRMKQFQKGSEEYSKTVTEIAQLKASLSGYRNRMFLVDYRKAILLEDYCLEGEIKPNFIRLVDTVSLEIASLERTIAAGKDEVRKKEKELALLITNTDRMKSIMGKALSSGPQSPRDETTTSIMSSPNFDTRTISRSLTSHQNKQSSKTTEAATISDNSSESKDKDTTLNKAENLNVSKNSKGKKTKIESSSPKQNNNARGITDAKLPKVAVQEHDVTSSELSSNKDLSQNAAKVSNKVGKDRATKSNIPKLKRGSIGITPNNVHGTKVKVAIQDDSSKIPRYKHLVRVHDGRL